MQESFEFSIIQILYVYMESHPGDYKMKISDLRSQLSEIYGDVKDKQILPDLIQLRKKEWINYQSLVNQLAGLVWIEPDGINVARDIESKTPMRKSESCPTTIEQLAKKYPAFANSILRKELIRKIEDYCIQPFPQCRLIILSGEPRVGKTQALKLLKTVLSSRFFSLLVDGHLLNEISDLDIFTYNLALRIKQGFELWSKPREPNSLLTDPQWSEFSRGNGAKAFYKFWKELQQSYQGRCIVLLDELTYLLDSPKDSDPKFILNFLHSFVNSVSNIYLILTVSNNFRSSNNKQFIELIDSGILFKVTHYSDDTTLNVFSVIKDHFQCEDDFLSYCIALCDGHPEIMDATYSEIIKYATFPLSKHRLDSSDFEQSVIRIIDKTHEKLFQLWRNLSKDERNVIRLVSRKSSTNRFSTPTKLIEEFHYCTLQELVELAKGVPEINSEQDRSALYDAIDTLVQREWIEWMDLNKRTFRFKLGILPLWLRRNDFEAKV